MSEYVKPSSIDEALQLGSREGAAYLGGGTWLNSRPKGEVRVLVSLEELGLDGIEGENGIIRIGSCVRFQDILEKGSLPEALVDAVSRTASRTLRNMITVGGDLALHEPSSCLVPALIVLGATVLLAGKTAETGIEEYLKSEPGALIVEVRIPDRGLESNLRSLSRTSHSRKSLVCAAAAGCSKGVLQNLRIAAGDCVTGAVRLTEVEAALEGRAAPVKPEIEELVRNHFAPKGDFHAGADYKRYMAGVTVADILHYVSEREGRS